MRFNDYSGTEQFRPLSAWAYYGYSLLFSIPIIGWIFLLVFTFSTKNYNRRSFARSYWCSLLVALIIIGCLLGIVVTTGWLGETVETVSKLIPEASEMMSDQALPIESLAESFSDLAAAEDLLSLDISEGQVPVASIEDVTPEFKKTMDELEALADTFIEFMEDYEDGDVAITKMPQYLKMITKLSEAMEALDQIDESTMTDADIWYYTEVKQRLEQKFASFEPAQ